MDMSAKQKSAHFTPVQEGMGQVVMMCDDCVTKVETWSTHSFVVLWAQYTLPCFVVGAGLAWRLNPTAAWMRALLSSGGVYGGLALLATISVAATVRAEQLNRSLVLNGQTESEAGNIIILELRQERNHLMAGIIASLVTELILGILSVMLAAALLLSLPGDGMATVGAVAAIVVALWTMLELGRLLSATRPDDRLAAVKTNVLVRSTQQRMQKLAKPCLPHISASMISILGPVVVSGVGIALQCSLSTTWPSVLAWGLVGLAHLLIMTVWATWVGKDKMLHDQHGMIDKLTLMLTNLMLLAGVGLALVFQLFGFGGTQRQNVVRSGVVMLLECGFLCVVVTLTLWGSAGHGVLKSLASARASAMCARFDDGTLGATTSTKRSRAMSWLSWLVLPVLSVTQPWIAERAVGNSVNLVMVVLGIAPGVIWYAVGRLSAGQAALPRRVMRLVVATSQLAMTILWMVATVETGHAGGGIVVLSVGLLSIVVFLLLFGATSKTEGLVGAALANLEAEWAGKAWRRLNSIETDSRKLCRQEGCVNYAPLAERNEAVAERATRAHHDHGARRQVSYRVGVAARLAIVGAVVRTRRFVAGLRRLSTIARRYMSRIPRGPALVGLPVRRRVSCHAEPPQHVEW